MYLKHAIAQDGIEVPREFTGKKWAGLRFHGTARDRIEIPREFTGRNFTRRKKHGAPWDGIEISITGLHGSWL